LHPCISRTGTKNGATNNQVAATLDGANLAQGRSGTFRNVTAALCSLCAQTTTAKARRAKSDTQHAVDGGDGFREAPNPS
jgi:hypothetical protein